MTAKKTKLFGTDGIRAKAGEFPLDSQTVRTIGASLARHLAEQTGGRTPVIVTGRYNRGAKGTIRLKGMRAGQPFTREIAVNFPGDEKTHDVLATLWARTKIEHLMSQAQTAMRQGRAMGVRTAQALMDSYSALVSGVLIGTLWLVVLRGLNERNERTFPRADPPSSPPDDPPANDSATDLLR